MAEDHLVRLAEATPAEKYTWRTCYVQQDFAHGADALGRTDFDLPRVLGGAPPAGLLGAEYATSTTAIARQSRR